MARRIETEPRGASANERQAGDPQAVLAGRVRVAQQADPKRADQRQQNRQLDPWDVQNRHASSSPAGSGTAAGTRSDSRDSVPERKSVQRRSSPSQIRNTCMNGRVMNSSIKASK